VSYIDGLATGLDTTSIIKSLMQLEARPKVLLQQRAQTTKAGLDAFASIRTKTSAVRTAADALATPTAWRALTATSSNPDAVSVTAGSGATTGTLSFSVTQLAAAEVRTSADTFGGLDASLDGRTLTIGAGDTTLHLDGHQPPRPGRRDQRRRRPRRAGIHHPGAAGSSTSWCSPPPRPGAANGFTVTGEGGWQIPFTTVTVGRDAILDVGGITVTRPSNTIDRPGSPHHHHAEASRPPRRSPSTSSAT
jgi:flagellar hook-associated protein 2